MISELYSPLSVSCSNDQTFLMLSPSDEIVKLSIKPSLPYPAYARAYSSELILIKEGNAPVLLSVVFWNDFTCVMLDPSSGMVKVLRKP